MGMCFGKKGSSRNNTDNMNQLKENSGPVIFLIGAPSIGKRDLGRRLSSRYGFFMISTGDLLKREIENGSERGQKFADITRKGRRVSANDILPMVEEQLMTQPNAIGFLIVGFPRDVKQVKLILLFSFLFPFFFILFFLFHHYFPSLYSRFYLYIFFFYPFYCSVGRYSKIEFSKKHRFKRE